MKTKITINKELTEKWYLDQVKEDSKDFAERFTPNDLLRAFTEAMEEAGRLDELGVTGWCGEITACTAEAFPGGWKYNNETHYCVSITAEGWKDGHEEVTKYRFYIDQSGVIHDLIFFNQVTGDFDKMYTIKRFILQG